MKLSCIRENVVRYSHECLRTVYIHSLHNAMRYSVFVCCPITDLAAHLTETNRGKHFIGDFLPPDELERFMETFKVCSGRDDSCHEAPLFSLYRYT